MDEIGRIAVIGAGMAGLSCALALAGHRADVVVYDKGRRPGGRIATRRADGLAFDHGAQYATARTEGFRRLLAELQEAGAAAPWPAAGEARWVGVPGMSAIPGRLAAALPAPVLARRHVAHLHASPEGWRVRHLDAAAARPGAVGDAGGDLSEPFDAVLLALPAPQAEPLLRALGHRFADDLAGVAMAPCWALMAAFAGPSDAPDIARPAAGPLGWVARGNSRPGRAGGPECWVAHARPDWSRAHLERPAEEVSGLLLDAFRGQTGARAAPLHAAAHRWRHALTETPLGRPCLWDAAARIGVCGDWCLDARVEAARESGIALAEAVREGAAHG